MEKAWEKRLAEARKENEVYSICTILSSLLYICYIFYRQSRNEFTDVKEIKVDWAHAAE